MISIDLYSNLKYQNQSQMKGKKPAERPPSHKLLSGESEKLKDKLQILRQQIKIKKQQKEMNKTTQSISSYSSAKTTNIKQKMNSTAYSQKEDKQLYNLLAEMKMENIEPKLKEKNIMKIDQLVNTSEEEIDKWKDIPVGYRIKLKKYIEKNKQKSFSPLNGVVYQDQNTLTTQKKEKNIEDIIKNRNADKMFVPIHRQSEQDTQQQPELEQQEQQKMMLSILQVINAKKRNTCFKNKKNSEKSSRKIVHWSVEVDQMQKNHTQVKIYPKQTISKSIFNSNLEPAKQQTYENMSLTKIQKEQFSNIKYCWSCLKKINKEALQQNERQYCSKKCQSKYLQTVNPVGLFRKIQQTQEQYKTFLEEKLNLEEDDLDFNIS